MKKTMIHSMWCLFVVIAGIAFMTSCVSDEGDSNSCTAIDSEVAIKFNIGSADAETRATETKQEDGWQAWNENKITRLNLLLFDANGGLIKHLTWNNTYDGSENNQYYTIDIPKIELTRDEVANAEHIYLIANADETTLPDNFEGTEEKLKQKQLTGLNPYEKQNLFTMDAIGTPSDEGHNKVIKFELTRAMAKIRIYIENMDVSQVSCKFMNYADITSLVSESSVAMPDKVLLRRDVDYKIDMQKWEGDRKTKLVFYSYPNDWFDSSNPQPWVDQPIIKERQTYIMIKAPFEDKMYYYKIPVNYRLPDDGDEDKTDTDHYHDLYQLRRNHIYDITVKIDRAGGTDNEPVQLLPLEYQVQDWTGGKGGTMDFN